MTVLVEQGLITTKIHIKSPDSFDVERIQDVAPILDANKRDQVDEGFGYTEGRDMRHVARIPLILLEQWAKESGLRRVEVFGPKMNEIIRRKLNDPDYRWLRTGGGVV